MKGFKIRRASARGRGSDHHAPFFDRGEPPARAQAAVAASTSSLGSAAAIKPFVPAPLGAVREQVNAFVRFCI
jgi:hypothetical protein